MILRIALAAATVSAAQACTSSSKPEPADAGGQCVTAGLPQFSSKCSNCHDIDLLARIRSDESAGPKEWASANGAALTRVDPAFPAPGMFLNIPWSHRGRHVKGELEAAACASCHPVRSDGMGHEVRTWPGAYKGTVFSGGRNCAGSCHVWLSESVVSRGFVDSDGGTPAYTGSARAASMLDEVQTAHTKIWKEGYSGGSKQIKIAVLRPGCGGCHQAQSEYHGVVPSCLTCHNLGGSKGALHAAHVSSIKKNWDKFDPKRPQMTECAYCHYESAAAESRSRAACHNCHLSGHQPVDGSGLPHFWQAGD
jgi:hypothetical protein